jgi:hypothetical protein
MYPGNHDQILEPLVVGRQAVVLAHETGLTRADHTA